MQTYTTSQVAHIFGVHPNTVRLYETLGLIPKPERRENGYRIFTDFHIGQFRLARTAFEVEVLQNGLRKLAVQIVKTSARMEFDEALALAGQYTKRLQAERKNAEEAALIAARTLPETERDEPRLLYTRKEAARFLHISADTLRNWERNGLLTVQRRQNGYRVYGNADISRLKMIRSLRCANYSLAAILRMLGTLSGAPCADIRQVIDTPGEDEDIVSVCDRLITSLKAAENNAGSVREQLTGMKAKFS